jgi:hypothetical protein
MKTQVVTVANRIPCRGREPYYYYESFAASLRRFGAEPVVLGMNEPWWGLMTKPRRIRQWLRDGHCTADALIVSDAFDVIFTAHPDAVGEAWGGGDGILFNAEKDLFPPRHELTYAFPDVGSPWRYLNGGVFIGKPSTILEFYERLNLDDLHDDHVASDAFHGGANRIVNVNDGLWYLFAYALKLVPVSLDTQCRLFQTLSSCTLHEFDLSGERVKNRVTGTAPLVWHFNGAAKNEMMPDMLKKWGLW